MCLNHDAIKTDGQGPEQSPILELFYKDYRGPKPSTPPPRGPAWLPTPPLLTQSVYTALILGHPQYSMMIVVRGYFSPQTMLAVRSCSRAIRHSSYTWFISILNTSDH